MYPPAEGGKPLLHQMRCFEYETKLHLTVCLLFWRVWSTLSLALLSDPLWPGVVVPVSLYYTQSAHRWDYLLGFVCDHLLTFAISPLFFLGFMHPHMTFQSCQIAENVTTDWALSVVLARMNVIMWSIRLDMFAHMAFKTSKWETVFPVLYSWCVDFVNLVLVLVLRYELIVC